jgi:DNA repair photolyase
MFADKVPRPISYHDTWISIDPIEGCPYQCVYCVLRHANKTSVRPEVLMAPDECARQLLNFPLFTFGRTPLAIGNETDMMHPFNQEYLIDLLRALQSASVSNPISLITKTPLTDKILERIRSIKGLRIVFFLSYSGLGPTYEPNFADQRLRENFHRVRAHGFPLIHYWRPLLPNNTSPSQIRNMLSFVSSIADASVIVGLKLHPELNDILTRDAPISIPDHLMDVHGEWLEPQIVEEIHLEANHLCPDYPLYRHASCALASILARPNHTATIYREDICPPSHCLAAQRAICRGAQVMPSDTEVAEAFSKLGRIPHFERLPDRVVVDEVVSQEEFSYLLHALNCPLEVTAIRFENLYRGSIHANQREASHVCK